MVPFFGLFLADLLVLDKLLERTKDVSEPRETLEGRMVSLKEERAPSEPELSAPGHPASWESPLRPRSWAVWRGQPEGTP